MSSDIIVSAEHQHVLCKTMAWKDVFPDAGIALPFSKQSGLHAPDQGTGHKDTVMVLEVLSTGPGNVSRGTRNPVTVKRGDIVLANQFHKGHDVRVLGSYFETYGWENIMAKLSVDAMTKQIQVEPLQAFYVCRRNEERAAAIMKGEHGSIHSPGGDSHLAGAVELDQRGRPMSQQVRIAIEEVVGVGPGAVIDGLFQQPTGEAGDMVMYDTSVTPVQVRISGEAFTLVNFRQIILTFREVEALRDEPVAEDAFEKV